jgi:type II restriction/modification system DNA methylase subunit YeeA
MRRNGLDVERKPILRPLETIACRDAVLNADGSQAAWPEAEFIVGNPPVLGNKHMISGLGEDYTASLRRVYGGRVPGGADLVTYWVEKARAAIEQGKTKRAGLVATNSIRGGDNRKVLTRIRDTISIFEACSDEPCVVEGAAVRVSLVCFAPQTVEISFLDGKPVVEIFSDLTARISHHTSDLTKATQRAENAQRSFMGVTQTGPFDIPGSLHDPGSHSR